MTQILTLFSSFVVAVRQAREVGERQQGCAREHDQGQDGRDRTEAAGVRLNWVQGQRDFRVHLKV